MSRIERFRCIYIPLLHVVVIAVFLLTNIFVVLLHMCTFAVGPMMTVTGGGLAIVGCFLCIRSLMSVDIQGRVPHDTCGQQSRSGIRKSGKFISLARLVAKAI